MDVKIKTYLILFLLQDIASFDESSKVFQIRHGHTIVKI